MIQLPEWFVVLGEQDDEREWQRAREWCTCRPPIRSLRVYLGHRACECCRLLIGHTPRRAPRLRAPQR